MQIYAVKEQQLLKLKIDIDDVNDNSPFFQSQSIVVNVSENALIGDFISLNKFLAVDHDIGKWIDSNKIVKHLYTLSICFYTWHAADQLPGYTLRRAKSCAQKVCVIKWKNYLIKLELTFKFSLNQKLFWF